SELTRRTSRATRRAGPARRISSAWLTLTGEVSGSAAGTFPPAAPGCHAPAPLAPGPCRDHAGLRTGPLTPSSRHADRVEDALDDRVRRDAVGLRLERQHDAVPQHVRGDVLDVLGRHVVAAREPGPGAGRAVDAHARPRARAVENLPGERRVDRPGIAGRDDDVDDVLLELVGEIQIEYGTARFHHRALGQKLLRAERVALAGLRLLAVQHQDAALVLDRGVTDFHVQQETVELRFRQRVRALLLDRVLGGHHHEQARQRVALLAHRDLPLLHRLEQRRLHLRRRAVDLVGEDQVVEQRTLAELEAAVLRPVDLGAGEVGRQQVRRELEAVEIALDAFRQHLDGAGLGEARLTLDQQVPVAQERDQHAVDQMRLSDDQAAGVRFQPLELLCKGHRALRIREAGDSSNLPPLANAAPGSAIMPPMTTAAAFRSLGRAAARVGLLLLAFVSAAVADDAAELSAAFGRDTIVIEAEHGTCYRFDV